MRPNGCINFRPRVAPSTEPLLMFKGSDGATSRLAGAKRNQVWSGVEADGDYLNNLRLGITLSVYVRLHVSCQKT